MFTGKRFSKVIGDNEYYSPKHILDFFDYCKEIFLWGADYYFWDLPKNGSIFCWDKRVDENMDKVAGNCIELCWSKYKHKKECIRLLWSGHHGMQSDDTKKRVHPTQKPAKLIEWFFERFKGQTVVDLFLGSGSTLIACEKTGRTCYGCELDEHYNSVIIKRWQDFTGKQAVREG
jgi:DNA modification methylase